MGRGVVIPSGNRQGRVRVGELSPDLGLDKPTPVTGSTRDRATGVDIRVDRAGRGRPVVILNGLLGLNEHWFPCLGPLTTRAECLLLQPPLLEMRGKGLSVEGVAHLIESVLETLTDEPAIMVGNSLGGHVALRLAHRRPDLVAGLVLIGSSGLFERSFEQGVQHDPSREWLTRKITELFYDPARMLPGLIDMAYNELSRRTAARALVRLGRSAKRDHLGEILGEIRQPTLLLWGRNDIVTPADVAHEFHARMPGATLRWIDRCGHAPQIECPEEVAQGIAWFLDHLAAAEREGRAGVA